MISTSKQCEKHLFAGQNAQQSVHRDMQLIFSVVLNEQINEMCSLSLILSVFYLTNSFLISGYWPLVKVNNPKHKFACRERKMIFP